MSSPHLAAAEEGTDERRRSRCRAHLDVMLEPDQLATSDAASDVAE
jgi:hypothetical protein